MGDLGLTLAVTTPALVEGGATNNSVACSTEHFVMPALRGTVPKHVGVLDMIELTILWEVRLARSQTRSALSQTLESKQRKHQRLWCGWGYWLPLAHAKQVYTGTYMHAHAPTRPHSSGDLADQSFGMSGLRLGAA